MGEGIWLLESDFNVTSANTVTANGLEHAGAFRSWSDCGTVKEEVTYEHGVRHDRQGSTGAMPSPCGRGITTRAGC